MTKNRTVLFGLSLVLCQSLLGGQSNNACNAKELANAERRVCYARAQSKLTAEVKDVVTDQVAEFNRNAADTQSKSPVAADALRTAAADLISSQNIWKKYRERHCTAVFHRWTTGSGAGTAYEACLFRVTQQRLAELKIAFR